MALPRVARLIEKKQVFNPNKGRKLIRNYSKGVRRNYRLVSFPSPFAISITIRMHPDVRRDLARQLDHVRAGG